MLTLQLPEADGLEAVEIKLEHSLLSLSEWEAEHEKAFFSRTEEAKSDDEYNRYVQLMLVSDNVDKSFTDRLTRENYETIGHYINAKRTATTFAETGQSRGNQEAITAELVYYWMISFQIPFYPCEHWHLNRLMTLIRIAGIKQTKPKKMSKAAWMQQQARLNAERREKLGTTG